MNNKPRLLEPLKPFRVELADGDLFYIPAWIEKAQADEYYSSLVRTLAWQQDKIQVFGKWHSIPRLQAWYGDAQAVYQYSGKELRPEPWTAALAELQGELAKMGLVCNSVLANWYRDGDDKMGWHSDNEPELGRDPWIASVSLGATRCFQLRHRATKQRLDIELEHGSLLLMGGVLQSHWQHSLPQRKRCRQGRVNLTFRHVLQRKAGKSL